jgi:hypothetical protein
LTHCPSTAELGRWLADGLAGAEAAGVEAHVETCADCQQTLEQLTRNADDARGSGPVPRGESGGDFLRRLERAPPAGLGPPPAPGGRAALAPHSVAPQLPPGTTDDYLGAPREKRCQEP